MKKIPIVGLLGRSRSGKDTVAAIIQTIAPEYQLIRLAEPIKSAVTALFGFSFEQIEMNRKEEIDARYGCTPRDLMVWLTSSTMAKMGPDFFFHRAMNKYVDVPYKVIPDVRYVRDIEAIRSMGGIILKVVNDRCVKHAFEDHIDDLVGDALIDNNCSMEQLEERVKLVLKENGIV